MATVWTVPPERMVEMPALSGEMAATEVPDSPARPVVTEVTEVFSGMAATGAQEAQVWTAPPVVRADLVRMEGMAVMAASSGAAAMGASEAQAERAATVILARMVVPGVQVAPEV